MRIVLFTVDDVDFVPPILGPLLKQRGSQIVAAFLSNAVLDWPRLRRRARFFFENKYPFCISAGDWKRFIVAQARARLFGRNGYRSVRQYLQSFGVSCQSIDD